ncbi:MAG: type II toxin-antitoxin system HicB family antitoxin, partial [Candidatus Solibacter usitatus]|nr:type II toxin-antitoxin system HicB family antitoxin [Candidatus Solibacter usitatus]
MSEYRYTVLFEPAEEGGYVVTCPALPGLVTEGDTYEEAHRRVVEAIEGCLESLQKDGLPFPPDKKLSLEPVKEEIRIAIPEPAWASTCLPCGRFKRKTLASIIEQAGYSPEEFIKLLEVPHELQQPVQRVGRDPRGQRLAASAANRAGAELVDTAGDQLLQSQPYPQPVARHVGCRHPHGRHVRLGRAVLRVIQVVVVGERVVRRIGRRVRIHRLREGQLEAGPGQPHAQNIHGGLAGKHDALEAFGRSPDPRGLRHIQARAVRRKRNAVVAGSQAVAIHQDEAGALVFAADLLLRPQDARVGPLGHQELAGVRPKLPLGRVQQRLGHRPRHVILRELDGRYLAPFGQGLDARLHRILPAKRRVPIERRRMPVERAVPGFVEAQAVGLAELEGQRRGLARGRDLQNRAAVRDRRVMPHPVHPAFLGLARLPSPRGQGAAHGRARLRAVGGAAQRHVEVPLRIA